MIIIVGFIHLHFFLSLYIFVFFSSLQLPSTETDKRKLPDTCLFIYPLQRDTSGYY